MEENHTVMSLQINPMGGTLGVRAPLGSDLKIELYYLGELLRVRSIMFIFSAFHPYDRSPGSLFTPLELGNASIDFLNIFCPCLSLDIFHVP